MERYYVKQMGGEHDWYIMDRGDNVWVARCHDKDMAHKIAALLNSQPIMRTVRRYGFKSKRQLPLFMVWDEFWECGEVVGGHVIVNSMDWPHWKLRRWLRRKWLKLTHQPFI